MSASPHTKVLTTLVNSIPVPKENGVVVTIIGHGFGGDMYSRGGKWVVIPGFKVSACFPPPTGFHRCQ